MCCLKKKKAVWQKFFKYQHKQTSVYETGSLRVIKSTSTLSHHGTNLCVDSTALTIDEGISDVSMSLPTFPLLCAHPCHRCQHLASIHAIVSLYFWLNRSTTKPAFVTASKPKWNIYYRSLATEYVRHLQLSSFCSIIPGVEHLQKLKQKIYHYGNLEIILEYLLN